ncbi:hypothetical protein SAMN06297144_2132 [Sphingomonas guangdongensis]|uniref:Uncharacterized protein n=1 Tax=Sphingomonas guangdongensis TaxID=1141890 RepID=A0A285R3S4_9SPHN|nr:hypothetical protein [Sphingomonas guangdongensis]SOB87012.1 hypothetical protein SAMN06297144_2132 [Sphingomonas guangdongensis]
MHSVGRAILIWSGAVVTALGLLFLAQGLGYVRWPASSFMIDARPWVTRGTIIAVVGLAMILVGRRVR